MPEFMSNLVDDAGAQGTLAWISAVFDLVIVFALVYITLLLIRGTRTVPMALGLLILFVVYLLSQVAGLTTTYLLLDQFMSVVVIFVLIIFQDDIRRALVRVGKFAWFSKARETQVVEEVIRAAGQLAKKRIGALIVFERDASLEEFIIEGGTRIDAAVTHELLHTIFVPASENPLHDGAAIIGNYRIRDAGVFLPLSANPRLDKVLGTRHRAALGITEETDAVSVVVSEERGTIALCFEGRMSRNLDQAALRKALLGLFSTAKTQLRREAAKERESKKPERTADLNENGEETGSDSEKGN
ncbi:MAG: diadenylate cyclase CdaA [Polyangia bacterium]